jgi:hypothetical protein
MLFAILLLLLPGCSVRSFFGLPPLPPAPRTNPFTSDDWASGLDILFVWGNVASVLVMVGCVAILVWVQIPSLRKWAWIGITSALTMLAMGVTFAVMKPFIPFIVMGMMAIGAAIGIWYLIVNFKTLKNFVHKDKDQLTAAEQKLITVCETIPEVNPNAK